MTWRTDFKRKKLIYSLINKDLKQKNLIFLRKKIILGDRNRLLFNVKQRNTPFVCFQLTDQKNMKGTIFTIEETLFNYFKNDNPMKTIMLSFFMVFSLFAMPSMKANPVADAAEEQVGKVGYALQIAATKKEPDLSKFSDLLQFGDLYYFPSGRYYKVRLGVYLNRQMANETLRSIKRSSAYRKAFIVEEDGRNIEGISINFFGAEEPVQDLTPRGGSFNSGASPDDYYVPGTRFISNFNYNERPSSFEQVTPTPFDNRSTISYPASYIYAVQLAASPSDLELGKYDSFRALGPVYVSADGSMYKYRIGPFRSRTEAGRVLAKAKRKIKSAFLVEEKGDILEVMR